MLRKAGIVALVAARSCVRGALTAVATLRQVSEREATQAEEIQALRAELEHMRRTLHEIGRAPAPEDRPRSKLLLQ